MARKKKKAVEVPLFKHNIVWWIFVGWWWRPMVYIFWIFVNVIFNMEIKFKKQK